MRLNSKCFLLMFIFLISLLLITSCGESTSPDNGPEDISISSMSINPLTINATNNEFELSWQVDLNSSLNYYSVWFYIIPDDAISSSSFNEDGEYIGNGVQIGSWGYNNTAVTTTINYNSETNEIETDTTSTPLGELSGDVYALLCVATANPLAGEVAQDYRTINISISRE